ncbi:MAG: hypothetical protein M3X11_17850 [Acidobacteriota bacterium]|nr:hypothetical protein [Acidobacteriota bacterium]
MSKMMQRYLCSFAATISLILIVSISVCAQQVPPAPSQDYDRFGSYFWTTSYKGYDRLRLDAPLSCSSIGNRQLIDTLPIGRDLIASIGTRTIRATIGNNYGGGYSPGYEPGTCGDAFTLKQWVQRPEYQALFNDNRFSTYILTYLAGRFEWSKSLPQNPGPMDQRFHTPLPNYTNAYDQMKDMVEYLAGQENGAYRFPGKTFIILNWEADSEFSWLFGNRCPTPQNMGVVF